jgi:hypothetical protein
MADHAGRDPDTLRIGVLSAHCSEEAVRIGTTSEDARRMKLENLRQRFVKLLDKMSEMSVFYYFWFVIRPILAS